MRTPLLATKLYVPPVRPELVSRPRLVELLNEGVGRKLTLISAPAGFGKTTVLSEWVHATDTSETRPDVAWLSLDEGDNDPVRFWTFVIAALQTVRPKVGESALLALQSPRAPPIESTLTALINDLATAPPDDRCTLILDDFHVIRAQPIHAALEFLIDHLPPCLHLVTASRADPPFSLSRLRGRGQLMELRAAHLRFTAEEAAAFLNQVMKLGLSEEEIAALDHRVEGWIAGLHMAALSIRGQGREHAARFIAAFTGSNRYILDYFAEEVVQRQTREIQTFLLQTAILDRLCAPLCDAVTGQSDSQSTLEELEQGNLFIIPLDNERRWYRYHHLFRELLQNRLDRAQPDRAAALHRQASEWYEAQGLFPEAVSHALAGTDVACAIRLIEGNALAMLDHGELASLVGWLDSLPARVVRSRPWLCVAYAWALAYGGRRELVDQRLEEAERAVSASARGTEGPVLGEAEREHVAGHIATIRAYAASLWGDHSRSAELAQSALERLPEDDLKTRAFAANVYATGLPWFGDPVTVSSAYDQALDISRAAEDPHLTVSVLCEQAGYQLGRGHLHQGAATCREALRLAEESARQRGRLLPMAGYAHLRMGSVLREWNDLEGALYHVGEGVRLSEQWGQSDVLGTAYYDQAWVLQAMGDTEGALDAIRQSQRIVRERIREESRFLDMVEAWIRLANGDVEAGSRWLEQEGLSADDEFESRLIGIYLTVARVLIAQGDRKRGGSLEQARRLLERIRPQVESTGSLRLLLCTLILQALALQALGETERALVAMEWALTLAQPEGFVRTFIREGAPVGTLLQRAVAQGIAPDYASRLLEALASERSGFPVSRLKTIPVADPRSRTIETGSLLVESLSERELQTLQLLVEGLSAPQIARELVISVNTAKSHIKSIYGKLDVHSRYEAIERARALRLCDPPP